MLNFFELEVIVKHPISHVSFDSGVLYFLSYCRVPGTYDIPQWVLGNYSKGKHIF